MLSLIPEAGTPYPSSQETEKQPACSFSVRPNRLKRPLPSVAITGIYSPVMLGPNITGTTGKYVRFGETADTGALSKTVEAVNAKYGTTAATVVSGNVIFDASKSNSIYGLSYKVQSVSMIVQYLIKY